MTVKKKTIRELREERKWRPEELVSKIGGDTAQLRQAENVGPDIGILTRSAKAFGVAPEDIALPPHMRLVNVQGHLFHLTTNRHGSTMIQARVSGWDPSGAKAEIKRGPDPDHPDTDSATVFMSQPPGSEEKWRETAATDAEALDALERRVVEAMTYALA